MAASLCRNAGLPLGRTLHESQQLLNQTTAAALLPRPLDFTGIEDISEIVTSALSGELPTVGELCVVERTLVAARSLFGQLEEFCLNGEITRRLDCCACFGALLLNLELNVLLKLFYDVFC